MPPRAGLAVPPRDALRTCILKTLLAPVPELTAPPPQAQLIPFVAASRVICLELHCTLRDPQGRFNTPESCDTLRMILSALAAPVPNLQFLLLNITLPTIISARRPPPKLQYWWRIGGLGAGRTATEIATTRGARISAYLSSPAYDCSVAFDGG